MTLHQGIRGVSAVLTMALLAMIACSAPPASAQARLHVGRASCTPLKGFDPAEARRRPGDDAVVPLAIHLMVADLPAEVRRRSADDFSRIAPSEDYLTFMWSPMRIRKHFLGEEGARKIWEPKGLRVAIARVEQCRYSPRQFRRDRELVDAVFIPEATDMPGHKELFKKVHQAYRVEDIEALDVYLWWSISDGSTEGGNAWGYGRSKKGDGPAAWADISCVVNRAGVTQLKTWLRENPNADFHQIVDDVATQMPSAQCGRILAHELGHALGLLHEEGETKKRNLMHPSYEDTDINAEQVKTVKENARENFPAINPPSRPGK